MFSELWPPIVKKGTSSDAELNVDEIMEPVDVTPQSLEVTVGVEWTITNKFHHWENQALEIIMLLEFAFASVLPTGPSYARS